MTGRLPRRTVRLRLTVLYGCLFLLSGAGLLAITYVLVSGQGPDFHITRGRAAGVGVVAPQASPGASGKAGLGGSGVTGVGVSGPGVAGPTVAGPTMAGPGVTATVITDPAGRKACVPDARRFPSRAQIARCLAFGEAVARQQRAAELTRLLTESGVALAIMTVASVGLGWLVAGRVLRPLRTITAAARSISATSLHARLAMDGPHDELQELGDTFDGLLARLEAAFGAQRQFVANASHELRTPLARQQTLVEVALADPEPSLAGLQEVCRRVLATGAQQERLIEALLTLARSQRGLDRPEPVDLAQIADDVVTGRKAWADEAGITLRVSLAPARIRGDARLAERLIANLVDNAVRHNAAGGTVEVAVGAADGQGVLSVENTGPEIAAQEVARLFEPFRRGGSRQADRAERCGRPHGLGLGLSIVSAIATAHGASLRATARPGGGLRVQVGFPLGRQSGAASAA